MGTATGPLVDGEGFNWAVPDASLGGGIVDTGVDGSGALTGEGLLDGFGSFWIGIADNGSGAHFQDADPGAVYESPAAASRVLIDVDQTASQSGQYITFDTVVANGVTVSRQIYASDVAGDGFVRFFDTLTNNTDSTQTFLFAIVGAVNNSTGTSGDGIEANYIELATSSGDSTTDPFAPALDENDFWYVIDEGSAPPGTVDNNPVAFIYGDGTITATHAERNVPSGSSGPNFTSSDLYFRITLAPGETKAFLSFAAQSTQNGTAGANELIADDIAQLTSLTEGDSALAGLTATQLGQIVNYNIAPAAPSNTAPTVATNTGSTVDEGATDTITNTELDTTDDEEGPGDLTYTLDSTTSNGVLWLDDGDGTLEAGEELTSGETFTQADIDAGDLRYTHDGGETTSDSFQFDVSDGTDSVDDQTFNITVTPQNDPPQGAVGIDAPAAQEGVTLTATNTLTDPDGLGTLSYQWRRDGVDIDGATGATYTPTQEDVGAQITVAVSYTDDGGTLETVVSGATLAIANVNDAPGGGVTISGTAQEDETLTAANSLTDEDGLGTVSYQWRRDGVDIDGATGETYTLGQDDVGAEITVVASYTDDQGTAESVESTATAAVANVNDAPGGGVTISGTAQEDETLTAANSLTDEDGLGTVSYQWRRDGVDIDGATGE
ncbi:MAG: cadherin-like domain-containing protein, partial [Oceanicaulis sp.]